MIPMRAVLWAILSRNDGARLYAGSLHPTSSPVNGPIEPHKALSNSPMVLTPLSGNSFADADSRVKTVDGEPLPVAASICLPRRDRHRPPARLAPCSCATMSGLAVAGRGFPFELCVMILLRASPRACPGGGQSLPL